MLSANNIIEDQHEQSCILALTHALQKPDCGSDIVTYMDKEEESTRSLSRKPILPYEVIRQGILSYRPFRSLRVVLIRGKPENLQNPDHYSGHLRQEYPLTFSTNRGPLRFRVAELPYLPPKRILARNSLFQYSQQEHDTHASFFQHADGVIISCYIARFFEFCDRYGYEYASTSILEDVSSRVCDQIGSPNHNRRDGTAKKSSDDNHKTVVLCGNGVDITHVDAKLSSIVFQDDQEHKKTQQYSDEGAEEFIIPARSFIDKPRHPFASLARSITKDEGLEFLDLIDIPEPIDADVSAVKMIDNQRNEAHLKCIDSKTMHSGGNDQNYGNWDWLRARVSS